MITVWSTTEYEATLYLTFEVEHFDYTKTLHNIQFVIYFIDCHAVNGPSIALCEYLRTVLR